MVRPSRPWGRAGVLSGIVCAGVVLVTLAGCATPVGVQWREPNGAPVVPADSKLVIYPRTNGKGFSPADPVTAEIIDGTLDEVTLTNAQGGTVKGELRADGRTWHNTEDLAYNKTYKLVVKGTGNDGKAHEETRTFTTVNPRNQTLATLLAHSGECAVPDDSVPPKCTASVPQKLLLGGTFGVGQLIIVTFDEPIKDKAAAERALIVTTDRPVVGGWRWVSDRQVRWRPKEYWPAGTHVTVEAKIYGRDLGGGLYGQCFRQVPGSCNRSASFTIGPSKIMIADSKTHRMKVYFDGVLQTSINGHDVTSGIPISMGKDGSEVGEDGVVDFRTQSGPHVITTKMPVKRMTSASFGITDKESPNYYDVKIKMSMRISTDGEFVHLADWNIPAHGKYNTSHGCVNVAPTYIYWLYDHLGPGDVVDVRNTGKTLTLANGGDWVLTWDQWQRGSALWVDPPKTPTSPSPN